MDSTLDILVILDLENTCRCALNFRVRSRSMNYSFQRSQHVTFTPQSTKNAKRNATRRRRKRLQKNQNQYEEQKKKTTIKKRLYGSKKSAHLRLGPPPKNTNTEKRSYPEAKADARRRDSQESIEEVDSQGRRLPKNKKTHHRQ